MRDITGKTSVIGIFGHPIEHSLSPVMHNAAFDALDLDYCYVPFNVEPEFLKDALEGVKAMGLSGLNITVPHKENVMPFLNQISPEASFIGAVNTIVNMDGRLVGYNTDGRGFMLFLEEEGIDVSDLKVLILGSGGAARAITWHLCQEAEQVFIHSRNAKTATMLVNDLAINYKNVSFMETLDEIAEADIIINSTPLGLQDTDELPFDTAVLREGQIVGDLIYRQTPLLKKASSMGHRTFDGLGMLLWQGVIGFEVWTGVEAPVDVMRKALSGAVSR
jgi:shikimate dehydrogenase